MMITIGGVAVTLQRGSLKISRAVGQRSTGGMTVIDLTNTLRFTQGMPVLLLDDIGNTVFSGVVTDDQRSRSVKGGDVSHAVQFADWHYLADKKLAPYSATNENAGNIAQDIVTNFLASEGVYTIKNLLTANQSDVETDTTGFTALQASTTLSRDTSTAWHGSASLKAVCDGTVTAQGFRATLPLATFQAGQTITLSAYLKGAGTVNLLAVRTDTFARIGNASTTTTLMSGAWQRVSTIVTLPNPLPTTGQIGIQVQTSSAQAVTFNSDGLMIEPNPNGTLGSTVTNLLSAAISDVQSGVPLTTAVATTGAFISRATDFALSVDATTAWHGSTSLKCVSVGNTSFEDVATSLPASSFTAGATYTLSFYAKGALGTEAIRYFFEGNNDGPGNGAIGSTMSVTLTTSWQRYSVTATMPNPITQSYIGLRIDTGSDSSSVTFWLDGLQLETGNALSAWTLGGTMLAYGGTAWELGGTSSVQAGPLVVFFLSGYGTCAASFDAMAQKAGDGWYWQIDINRRFWFTVRTSAPLSPFVASEDIMEIDSIQPVHGNPNYANTVYMLGGVAQTTSQTETRKGDSNTTAFLMSYPLAHVPTITLNGTAQTVGIQSVDTGKQWYWDEGSDTISQDSSGTKLISTDTLSVTYVGQFPNVTKSADNSAISKQQTRETSGTGIVEAAVVDATLTSTDQAFQAAAGYLSKYAQDSDSISFMTHLYGLVEGQLLTVNVPPDDFNNEQMLIEQVDITDSGPYGSELNTIWYTVKAISGPINTGWQSFFKKLASQQAAFIDSIQVGQSGTLALLESATVAYTWGVTGTATVNTLLIPSATLYPQTTLYPGTAGTPVAVTWTKTNAGRNALRDSGLGLSTAYFAWGTGSQGTPATATQLGAEVGRKALTSYTAGSSAGEELITEYLSPQDAVGVAITEIAIFSGPTASSTANSGTMLLYGVYSHTKTNQESIQYQVDSTLA